MILLSLNSIKISVGSLDRIPQMDSDSGIKCIILLFIQVSRFA